MASKITPNLFELSGENVTVTYSTTSVDGKPRFSYKKGRVTLDFQGNQIKSEGTGIGTLVSVVIATVTDQVITTFSILLPEIRLGESRRASFRTIGITTRSKTTIAGPPLGAQQTYKVIDLQGSSKRVDF